MYKTIRNLMRGMCIIGIAVMTMAFMQSCEKTTGENNSTPDNNDPIVENNPFIGTWVANTTYDFYISQYGQLNGNLNYTLKITDDNRCSLEGTNHISYQYGTGYSQYNNTEDRSDDYFLMYDIESDKCIKVKGHSYSMEDGFYFDDGALYLMKNMSTITAAVCVQCKDKHGVTRQGTIDVDFIKQ